MSIKRTEKGYLVDARPQGRDGKRYRKTFATKAEAMQYEKWLMATKNSKDWLEKPRDNRPLSDLIDLWVKYHGQYQKTAVKDTAKLRQINIDLGCPKVHQVTKSLWLEFRAKRTAAGISANTLNRQQMLLSSVFTQLIAAGEVFQEHPLKGLPKMKIRAREMSFLSNDEILVLLSHLTGDELKIAKLCLDTGARWSEAANLKGSQLANGKVTFVDTKNGKNRTIPITQQLFKELYTGKSGALFNANYQAFRATIKGLGFELPKGQAAHVLRHTYASHFVMNGGNILTLQKILGHATINQTMTYAHLAPDHLQDAITFRPMSTICQK